MSRCIEAVVPLGLAAGGPAALALSRTVEGFLFAVDAQDPVTFRAIAALLAVVAFTATLLPARRAARLDPVQVLTSE